MNINEKIVEVAKSYIGQEEILGNKGFKNKMFHAKMVAMGWLFGHAWCSYFVELVWKEAYKSYTTNYESILNKLFSGSVMTTWNNFNKSTIFTISNKPTLGALAVYQSIKNKAFGHICIVSNILNNDVFFTVDGNTDDKGSREGYIVAEKKRKTGVMGSLKNLGFIYPNVI